MKGVWVIDFGSQYTQLITRKCREIGYKSLIFTVEDAISNFQQNNFPDAIILSGGPQSVFEDQTDFSHFFNKNIPVLGICYGLQIMAHYFGGTVERGQQGEYGHAIIKSINEFKISTIPNHFKVWMSHFDHVKKVPEGFKTIFASENNITAGILDIKNKRMGLQFHPEVNHSDYGQELLTYFFQEIAALKPDWNDKNQLDECLQSISHVKGKKVLCAFSGGVDSLVAATLAHKIIGSDLYCFFVDQGLLRPQDHAHIQLLKKEMPLNIEILDVREIFLSNLEGIHDPERKRKIIGKTFIDVFEEQVHHYEKTHQIKFEYLLQGTLYPDVIESISPHHKDGKSHTIKSHHNVGGLPERMNLKLVEPLRFMFKDEVRKVGLQLGLKKEWLYRHPFPGPGIGVRVLGEIKRESILKVQLSDQILHEELLKDNLYNNCWQAFTVLLPVKTVGVKGDARAYEEVICLRVVNSTDGMTADWTELPFSFLAKVSRRITNEVAGVTRVVYDITAKPPGTIEWE
jgi:GMP synthase (glutamine-hydrolysing)